MMNDLDLKIRHVFPEESVYKDPSIYRVFSGFNLPSFVKDWLAKRFTDEEGNLEKEELSNLGINEEWYIA